MNAMGLRALRGSHAKCVRVQVFCIIIGTVVIVVKLFQRMIHLIRITKDLNVNVNTE
jgi:hypothetical protein